MRYVSYFYKPALVSGINTTAYKRHFLNRWLQVWKQLAWQHCIHYLVHLAKIYY